MNRTLPNRLFYQFCRIICRLLCMFYFRLRSSGGDNVPTSGGLLVLSHHQSMLDPVLIGCATQRYLSVMGREAIFHNKCFAWLLKTLGGFEFDREGIGKAGLKETIRRLKEGEAVIIFPEGTRSADGEVHPLKAGFALLARRANVPMIVVAMDGSSQSLPRGVTFPRPVPIHVTFAPPIWPEAAAKHSDEELTEMVFRQMQECHDLARARRLRK